MMARRTAELGAKILLVTANVGSLFEDTENLQKVWLKEFFETVKAQKPNFLALHCQECGGKSLESGVTEVKRFVKELMAAQELKDYSRARVYIDESYESPERFTVSTTIYSAQSVCFHKLC
ncbi:PREDICTED: type I inositol 1,4,5-trisphosphate 5-phosphatase-like isoform X2 [Poecilia mexicana]|uniref:type I inositol 1,4,5-trisphosphate 5-phosphatase-like isoform X2 n=1 Tax=Poecilia mexicana TaxID=48701 RepID=UPI00072DC2AE|nr:PREDICTED: type I inositol 1,4,5-trisphosphate 5-phosphatase-like isoform X2 [Poecilia mexicana]